MFRLRLTAGRATAPLGQPPIAVARGIEIPAPEILALRDAQALPLRADAPHALLYQAPPVPSTYRLDAATREPPPSTAYNARLGPDDDGRYFPLGFHSPAVEGGDIGLPLPQRMGGAPALPSAASGRTDLTSRVHAFLEPSPSLDADSVYLGFPRTLRRYQIHAVQQLLSRDGYLHADDPGTGKTVAACAAIQLLFQSRQVRRTLVICLEGGARHWAAHLATWAPGLAITAVRGDASERTRDWASPADVFLVDYDGLAADLEGGRLDPQALPFDLIVLDDVHAFQRRAGQPPPTLERLTARKRWALSSALPSEVGEWLTVFGFLTPKRNLLASEITLPNLTRRFLPDTLRRTKADLLGQLPRLTRDELWVELDPRQRAAYETVLLEERKRLSALGPAATRSHLQAALHRLHRLCNFSPGSLDGCKVRPLANLVEDIVSAGAKVVVFTQFRGRELEDLCQVLEAYGVVVADSEAPEQARDQALQRFRTEQALHVLLADNHLRPSGGPLVEASYIIHFDHSWNPAVRRRAEMRLHPDPGPSVAVNVLEFWVVDTIDERLHELLAERSLLPADLPDDVRAALLEDRLTASDLMRRVLEVPERPAAAAPATIPGPPVVVEPSEPLPAASVVEPPSWASRPSEVSPEPASPVDEPTCLAGPAALPSPPVVEPAELPEAAPEALRAAVKRLMQGLGFEEVAHEPGASARDMIAHRGSGTERELALVRLVPSARDIGVGEARNLLAALNSRPGMAAAYLVSNADFTSACRRLAVESGGRLRLIPGVDLGALLTPRP